MKKFRFSLFALVIFSLTIALDACDSNQKTITTTTTPTSSVQTPVDVTPTPTAESTTTLPAATVLSSSTPSPTSSPSPTPTPSPASTPIKVATTKPTKQPSPTPTSMPFKHVAINEDIMSTASREKLNADQKEMLAYLDDYEYYYNLHTDAKVAGFNFTRIDALSSFGVGEIKMKALDAPVYKQIKTNGEMHVHVEIKHDPKDETPYLSKDCIFVFSKWRGWWELGYMFD
jgi:hypothetical protein